jgi:hypothetical protein
MKTIYRVHEGNLRLQYYNNNLDYYTLNTPSNVLPFLAVAASPSTKSGCSLRMRRTKKKRTAVAEDVEAAMVGEIRL